MIIIFNFFIIIGINYLNLRTAINIKNEKDILSYLEKKYNYNPQLVDIKCQEKNKDLWCVYYVADNRNMLLILEKVKFFKNRYKFYGSSENRNR